LDSGLTVEMVEEEFTKIGAIKPGGVQVRNKKVGNSWFWYQLCYFFLTFLFFLLQFVVEFESRQSFEAIKVHFS
jgi:bacteriorhodopsin